jgi:hypothetical protein
MSLLGEAAELLAELVAAEDEEVERAYEAGVRAGRLAAALLLDRDGLIEDGRRQGRAEGFAKGLAFAERRMDVAS